MISVRLVFAEFILMILWHYGQASEIRWLNCHRVNCGSLPQQIIEKYEAINSTWSDWVYALMPEAVSGLKHLKLYSTNTSILALNIILSRAPNLTSLDLSNQRFERIEPYKGQVHDSPTGVIEKIMNLRVDFPNSEDIAYLSKLKELEITLNNTGLDLYISLGQIEKLKITSMQGNRLPPRMFGSNCKIKSLSLMFQELQTISPHAISDCVHLQNLLIEAPILREWDGTFGMRQNTLTDVTLLFPLWQPRNQLRDILFDLKEGQLHVIQKLTLKVATPFPVNFWEWGVLMSEIKLIGNNSCPVQVMRSKTQSTFNKIELSGMSVQFETPNGFNTETYKVVKGCEKELPNLSWFRGYRLKTLEYRDTPITKLSQLGYWHIRAIKQILISGAQMSNVSLYLRHTPKLNEIKLTRSNIQQCVLHIPHSKIELVDLSKNNLEKVTLKIRTTRKAIVNLANNDLTTMKQVHMADYFDVRLLDISYNKIISLDGQSFSGIKNGVELFIHGNPLNCTRLTVGALQAAKLKYVIYADACWLAPQTLNQNPESARQTYSKVDVTTPRTQGVNLWDSR